MAVFIVSMDRSQKRSSDLKSLRQQVDYIIERGVAGNRSHWTCMDVAGPDKPQESGDRLMYRVRVTFERRRRKDSTPENLSAEMKDILDFMRRAANAHKWKVGHATHDWPSPKPVEAQSEKSDSETDFIDFDRALGFDEITIPEMLVYGEDKEIESHPAFNTIYGRAVHIRIMAAAMNTMILTKGHRRNHHVLHGLPGCGKSSLMIGWQDVIGKGGFVSINANSATRAGIEGLFLVRLSKTGVPPFIFVEEIEKTLEQILTVWLSIMDDRAEVRKIVHGKLRHAIVRSLVFASANDKLLFDKIMGGRAGHPGALSSRMTGLYVPRPDWDVMKRILLRDIALYYPEAKKDADLWAYKCIEIAKEMGVNDPRTVTCFLDGRTRLLDDEYKEDIMRLHQLEREDKDRQKALELGEVDDDEETE